MVYSPESVTGMFLVHRHLRADGTRMSDVVKLTDIAEVVELVPKFGQQASQDWNTNNTVDGDLVHSFYLNDFASKENFHAILSYQ